MGRMILKSTRRVLGPIRSSVCSFARIAHQFTCHTIHCLLQSRALFCDHLFARSLTHSLTHSGAHGQNIYVYELNGSILSDFNPLCAHFPAPLTSLRLLSWEHARANIRTRSSRGQTLRARVIACESRVQTRSAFSILSLFMPFRWVEKEKERKSFWMRKDSFFTLWIYQHWLSVTTTFKLTLHLSFRVVFLASMAVCFYLMNHSI